MRYVIVMVALLTVACSGQLPTGASSVTPGVEATSAAYKPDSGRRTTAPNKFTKLAVDSRGVEQSFCDVGYVGPVQEHPSVQGTTVGLVFPGSDAATRGYEVQIDRRVGLSSNYVPALTTIVETNNPFIFLSSEGRYRATVRGLGCDNSVGPFTDPYVYFSTDGVGGDAPVAPPIIVPPPVDDPPPTCEELQNCQPPPPPPGDGDDNDDDDDNPPPPPPPPPPAFEDTVFCHVPAHGNGQTKTAHSQGELDAHIGQHEHDYLGACIVEHHGHD